MENKKCKNCDEPLHGEYCSNCGQRDIELLKFKKLIKDFFDHHTHPKECNLLQNLDLLSLMPSGN